MRPEVVNIEEESKANQPAKFETQNGNEELNDSIEVAKKNDVNVRMDGVRKLV